MSRNDIPPVHVEVPLVIDPVTPGRLRRRATAALLVAATLTGLSCGDDSAESVSTKPDGEAHWSYEGDTGPEEWGSLDPSFVACADGSAQTPIDIVNPNPVDIADLEFAYTAGPVKIQNNGHTVQAEATPGGVLRVDGAEFPLVLVHFHTPSEHTINGESVPVEMHFVHKTSNDEIAVVGAMVSQGDIDNAAWEPFVEALGIEEGDADVEATFDWRAMLPASSSTIRYAGSLTTPPCTEGVQWFIMAEPIELSAAQIAGFRAAYSGNNRPVQPLNGREIELDAADGS